MKPVEELRSISDWMKRWENDAANGEMGNPEDIRACALDLDAILDRWGPFVEAAMELGEWWDRNHLDHDLEGIHRKMLDAYRRAVEEEK